MMMPASRLLQLLLLIALVLAPICMMGGGAAMAAPAAMDAAGHHAAATSPAHCPEMDGQQKDEQNRGGDVDCRMACAGVLAQMHAVSQTATVANEPQKLPVSVEARGLNPVAEPPPPRLS